MNMATAAGDVIYHQGFDEDSSDVWDDSALIKAYDEAITSLRSGIVPENKKSGGKRSKKSKSKSPRNKMLQIIKGCKCKFFYENEFVVGEVTSIDQSAGTCQVVFGQEEENSTEILLDQVAAISEYEYETHLKMFDPKADHEDELEYDNKDEDYDEQAHNVEYSNQSAEYYQHLNNYKSGRFPHDSTIQSNWNRGYYNYPNCGADNSYYPNAYYPPPPPPPVPPMHGHPSFYMPPYSQPGMQNIPVPPLPPQPPPLAKEDITDELLSNLIMSWYMAGYRTGYYQAIKKSKDKSKKR